MGKVSTVTVAVSGSFLRTVRIARVDVAAFMLDQLVYDTYLRTATGVCT